MFRIIRVLCVRFGYWVVCLVELITWKHSSPKLPSYISGRALKTAHIYFQCLHFWSYNSTKIVFICSDCTFSLVSFSAVAIAAFADMSKHKNWFVFGFCGIFDGCITSQKIHCITVTAIRRPSQFTSSEWVTLVPNAHD